MKKIHEACKMCNGEREKTIKEHGKTLVALCDSCGSWRCLSAPFYPVEYTVVLDAK